MRVVSPTPDFPEVLGDGGRFGEATDIKKESKI